MSKAKKETVAEVLTVAEASKVKGISEDGIRIAIRDGRLPADKRSFGYLILRSDLEAWRPRRKKGAAVT